MPASRNGRFCAIGGLILLLETGGLAASQSAAPPAVDVGRLGPQIGAPVPAFQLSDQFGKQQSLESIRGAKGAILGFFRSADW